MSVETSSPARLGTYRLEKLLGRGGMGEVFLAWDERLERHVAIKRILSDPPPDERARARFRREARAVARLSHPAIVQVYDLLDREDGDCLVMEYVEGRGLSELIGRDEMELDLVLRLAQEIADGLADAHAKGLVHRDLKPDNVRVTPSGRSKILDFGLARLLWNDGEGQPTEARDSRASLTKSGALLGTIHAMSPEQASGRKVDHRSDLFALGGLLYEMLTGRPPFAGENMLDSLRRVISEEPVPLDETRPGLPRDLVRLVGELLEKEPIHRPQNARLVADALERLRTSSAEGPEAPDPTGQNPAPHTRPAPPAATVDAVTVAAVAGEAPTGEWPVPESNRAVAEGTAPVETVVRTLLFTDLVDSTRIIESLGDARAAELSARHDRMARDLIAGHGGLEIDKSDGFLVLFERPFDAVAFALAYHRALVDLSSAGPLGEDREGKQGDELVARIGIHLGEVRLRRNPPEDVSRGAKPLEVEGLAKPMAARLMSLAGPRQTLMSHGAFDLARRSAVDDDRFDEDLQWLAHGGYLFQGVEEPVEVYEVGVADFAPLSTPPDSEKARRTVSFSEELVLGWRPAVGQAVPRRPHWVLEERLGEGGFGEVWLAAHESGEKRVFKFCFEASRLRALKREVTLFRVLKESLGHRDDIARVLDWNFDAAPYFLEAEHTEGGDLASWAEQQGGLGAVPMATRLELVAQVADALAAAHSVGVLHKDVKPENILITHDVEGRPRVRLTDFGVGALVDRSWLDSQGLPALGFTETLVEEASTAGSRRYMAPELLEGKPASVQADLYSLGVLLYQVAVIDFTRALAPGWRREVEDALLAEDIALLVDGSPRRRPPSAGPVAQRLRKLETRHADRQATQRMRKRRRQMRVAVAVGAVLLVMAAALLVQATLARQEADRLRDRAEEAREQAEGLIEFMLGDLQEKLKAIGRLDTLDSAGEKALEYFESLGTEELGSRTMSRHAKALHQMGDVRMAQGDLDGALELFQQAVGHAERLVARDSEDSQALYELAQGRFWVGNVLYRKSQRQAALVEWELYLELSEELHRRQPENEEWFLEVAYGHNNVGTLLKLLDNLALAAEHFKKALEISRELFDRDPSDPSRRSRLVVAYLRTGQTQWKQGQLTEACGQYEKALEIFQAAGADLTDSEVGRQMASLHSHLGNCTLARGDLESAARHYRSQIDVLQELERVDPSHVEWRQLLGTAYLKMAEVLSSRGTLDEAEVYLDRAVKMSEELSRSHSEDRQNIHNLGRALVQRAETYIVRQDFGKARETAERAMAQVREEPVTKFLRVEVEIVNGRTLELSGRQQEAEILWGQALEARQPQARGSRQPHLLDQWVRLLLHMKKIDEARLPIYTLLGMGFRHPRFLALCALEAPDICPP